MPANIHPDFAVELCQFTVDKINTGPGPALLELYAGPKPANPSIAPSGLLIVSFDLPTPAFGDAVATPSGGTATANDIDPVAAMTTATIEFFRITTADGLPLLDGSVSDMNGPGMLKLSSVLGITGVDVVIGSLTITQRA